MFHSIWIGHWNHTGSLSFCPFGFFSSQLLTNFTPRLADGPSFTQSRLWECQVSCSLGKFLSSVPSLGAVWLFMQRSVSDSVPSRRYLHAHRTREHSLPLQEGVLVCSHTRKWELDLEFSFLSLLSYFYLVCCHRSHDWEWLLLSFLTDRMPVFTCL